MKKRVRQFLPSYAVFPLFAVLLANFLAYYGSRLLSGGLPHFSFALEIDRRIPFVPVFSVIYLLAYLQWIFGFLRIARESREFCFRMLSGEIIAKFLSALLFIAVPTTMVRAHVTGQDFFSGIVRMLYRLDAPDNLFPSVHCLESWLCFRAVLQRKGRSRWEVCGSLIFTLLVFASTVLVKQHVAVDIPAGVVVCEIGLFLSKKLNAGRFFAWADGVWRRKRGETGRNGKPGERRTA